MRLNSHVVPVRMQMTNTQNMNIYEMNTQKIPNSHVCYLDKNESKRINMDEKLSQVCSTEASES